MQQAVRRTEKWIFMMSRDSKIADMQSSFHALSLAASHLNQSTDALNGAVCTLDESLRKLNIGLHAWVTFDGWGEPPHWESRQIGYSKVGGKWGVAIRVISGDEREEEETTDSIWAFADAPREMRLDSIEKIPEVLASLTQQAIQLSEKVKAKVREAEELAAAVGRENPTANNALEAGLGSIAGTLGKAVSLRDLLPRGTK